MKHILTLFNQSSPESVLAKDLLNSAFRHEGNVVVSHTHANVAKKHPGVVWDVVNILGVDIPDRSLQYLLMTSPRAEISVYADGNTNTNWSALVKANVVHDLFARYGDMSVCEMVLAECKDKPNWLASLDQNELERIEQTVQATAKYYRFVDTRENLSRSVGYGSNDQKMIRQVVQRCLHYKDGLPMCNSIKENVWDVARLLALTPYSQFIIFEDQKNERKYWTYGLPRSWITEHYVDAKVWSQGAMLTFGGPKDVFC